MSNEPSSGLRPASIDLPIRRIGQWFIVALSVGVMVTPALTVFLAGSSQNFPRDWRRDLEGYVEKLPLFQGWRRTDQNWRSEVLGSGNNRVHLGDAGWLYYRPDLEAIHGKGPYWEEPPSVARASGQSAWQAPLPVVIDFAGQLRERGIRLVMVPVPTKPMMVGSGLGLAETITRPAAWDAMFADLIAAGVEAVDVIPVLARLPEEDRYLRHDTHWTPRAMETVADAVVRKLGEVPGLTPRSYAAGAETHPIAGDLVDMLDLPASGRPLVLQPEQVTLHPITDIETGKNPASDPASPVVLLGDSFVNIFDDPTLGFPEKKAGSDGARMGAGFAAQLSAKLGAGVDVITVNGGGATAVREELARRGDEAIRSKKVVVWVLSSRDLLLPELPARRAGIAWSKVSLEGAAPAPAPASPGAEVKVTGTLREVSFFEDPGTAPYPDAIYSVLFEQVTSSQAGSPSGEALVYVWAFRAKELLPTSRLEPGTRYQFVLEPLGEVAEVKSATRIDDLFRPDLPAWFAKEMTPVP